MQISPNGETSVNDSDLKNALDLAGYKLPNHKVRDLVRELKDQGKVGDDGRVSKEIFKEVKMFVEILMKTFFAIA